MRHLFSRTKEEIKRKLAVLYSEPLASYRDVLDFDRGYEFFSENESQLVKYSSRWFYPEKYDQFQERARIDECSPNQMFRMTCENGQRNEWKLERLGHPGNQLARDLEKLGRTPYHIGLEGEKFRVVAATLQKCNSPFVRRTFQFTSNGIIETPETRDDGEQMKLVPVINQGKKGVAQKLVTIRRFRVVKKDGFSGEKSLVPQKIKIGNGEKPRFLTVRIRAKEKQNQGEQKTDPDSAPEVVRLTSSTEEEDFDYSEKAASPSNQTEETDEGEEPTIAKTVRDGVIPEVGQKETEKKAEEPDSNDTDEASVEYDDFGKRFSGYQMRQQRQECQYCAKQFLSSKQLRDHVRTHHPNQRYTRSSGSTEDRIKTATSKFGRTRRVLNIAGLRSKYKML